MQKYIIAICIIVSVLYSCSTQKKLANTTTTTSEINKPVKPLTEKETVVFQENLINAIKEKQINDLDPNLGAGIQNYTKAINFLQACLKVSPNNATANYLLAQIYAKDNTLIEQAITHAETAYQSDPENNYIPNLLVNLYLEKGYLNKAAPLAEKLYKKYPHNTDYAFLLINAYASQGKYDNAIAIFNNLEQELGVMPEITKSKMELYLKKNDLTGAETEIKKLIKENPDEPAFYNMLAELYTANGKNAEAFAILKELEKKYPNDPDLNFRLAEFYRQNGDKSKSIGALQKSFENPDVNIDEKMKILFSLHETIDPELKDAYIKLAETIVKTHPKEAKAHSAVGDMLLQSNKISEARNAYLNAIQLDKSKFPIWNQVIMLDGELKDFNSMFSHSNEVTELFPTNPLGYYYKGISAYNLAKYKIAVEALEEGVTYIVNDTKLSSDFYASIGDCENKLNNNAKSDAAYESALKLNPDNIGALNNYAYYLSLRKENISKAKEMIRKATILAPNQASYEDTYAWVLFQDKKYEDADAWIDKALKNGGDKSGTIVEHKGDVLFKLGNITEALKYWQKAKELGNTSDKIDEKITTKTYVE